MRHCRYCGKSFRPRNRAQHCCSKRECQRKRKNDWQRKKMADDPHYRANQADAQRIWRKKRPAYMKEYRRNHPEYIERNRLQQRERRKRKRELRPDHPLLPGGDVVKMDARITQFPVISGTYQLLPVGVVKMDAIMVQLSVMEGVT